MLRSNSSKRIRLIKHNVCIKYSQQKWNIVSVNMNHLVNTGIQIYWSFARKRDKIKRYCVLIGSQYLKEELCKLEAYGKPNSRCWPNDWFMYGYLLRITEGQVQKYHLGDHYFEALSTIYKIYKFWLLWNQSSAWGMTFSNFSLGLKLDLASLQLLTFWMLSENFLSRIWSVKCS